MSGLSALIKSPLSKKHQDPKTSLVSLSCQIDTPPAVILNDPENRNSSLIKGRLVFDAHHDVEVERLHATLLLRIVQKKPFRRGCRDCKNQVTELKHCSFITPTATLQRGKYEYPFSYRVPDDLPPSLDTSIASVSYEFEAEACVRRKGQLSGVPRIVTLKRSLDVARSLSVPNSTLYSRRIFQAAGIEVGCHFGSIVDPNGTHNVRLTMDGLASYPGNGENVQIWRLWKGHWRLEETVKTIALACGRHANEIGGSEGDKAHKRSKVTVLGEDGIYNGWNTDDMLGTLDMEFAFSLKRTKGRAINYAHDTGHGDEVEVTHALVVELMLVKEYFPKGRPDLSIRTGVARILRSEHRVVLSDFARVSNVPVDECLPFYQELLPSPPIYEDDGSMEESTMQA
ncbi:LDB19 domain-containing protein [Fusarium sp. LHS14.1]|nr:LDB19 domain-containing protein [Fusarium sp. LHS14.1]